MSEGKLLVSQTNNNLLCLSKEDADSHFIIQFWVEGVVQVNTTYISGSQPFLVGGTHSENEK
jgi:hypothetical protein